MKHDSLNLTAPHTARELAQADTEAGAMHAKQIAAMIAEDGYLDRGEAGNLVSGDLISREAALKVIAGRIYELDARADYVSKAQGATAAVLYNELRVLPAAQIEGAA